MRHNRRTLLYAMALTALFTLAPASAQTPSPAPATPKPLFKPEELDQMLAPIALYPDSLLAQVLMAATYPLEVVEAARWAKANPNLKGDAAVKAVQDKTWDVSVKSLAAFPQVLAQMSDKLEWTQRLGDAMLSQQQDVSASIQRLRKLSYDAGKLKTSDQQKITVQSGTPQAIVIEPAAPQTIYVPVYQPTWAYGAWPYPAYPPFYYPPLPGYGYGAPLVSGFMFGVGVAAAGAMFSDWNWGGGSVNVNVNRALIVDRNFDPKRYENGRWAHQPDHRHGVAYRDAASRTKYGRTIPGADGRRDFRGKDIAGRPGGPVGQRPMAGGTPRPGPIAQPGRGAGTFEHGGAHNGGAFNGIDRGGQRTMREASRGRSSGGFRGGGGGGRGGGGGFHGGGHGGRR